MMLTKTRKFTLFKENYFLFKILSISGSPGDSSVPLETILYGLVTCSLNVPESYGKWIRVSTSVKEKSLSTPPSGRWWATPWASNEGRDRMNPGQKLFLYQVPMAFLSLRWETPWSWINHKLDNCLRMWKGIGNISVLLFSLKGLKILERRGQVNTIIMEHFKEQSLFYKLTSSIRNSQFCIWASLSTFHYYFCFSLFVLPWNFCALFWVETLALTNYKFACVAKVTFCIVCNVNVRWPKGYGSHYFLVEGFPMVGMT